MGVKFQFERFLTMAVKFVVGSIQADFLRVCSRVLGSMGFREVKVKGVQSRVVLQKQRFGLWYRAFS